MKIKILISSLFQFLLILCINAQPIVDWQITIGGSDHDIARSIQQTSDGGYIVAGSTLSIDGDVSGQHGGYDMWVVKLSTTGSIEWQKSLGGTNAEHAWSIQQTSDDGYIVVGSARSTDGDLTENNGSSDAWIVKLSSLGSIEWQKTYGGSADDEAYSVQQTSDGGYIVGGRAASADGDIPNHNGNYDFWIIKITNEGEIEWQRVLGGSDGESVRSIQQTSDGGYIAAGSSFSNDGDVDENNVNASYWVVKFSGLGETEWMRIYGGTSSDYLGSIQQTSDGGYVLTGSAYSNDGDVTENHGLSDMWVVKISNTGNIEWQKSLGGSSSEDAQSIQQTSDGGYIVVGRSQSNDGDLTSNNGWTDVWVVKLSNTGNMEWQKSLGGTSSDYGFSIQQTTDGGYIVGGMTQSDDGDVTNNYGGDDFWIIKLSPIIIAVDDVSDTKSFRVFPNPAKYHINIGTDNRFIDSEYSVYNSIGQFIFSGSLNSENTMINLDKLANGTYTIQIQVLDEIENYVFVKL